METIVPEESRKKKKYLILNIISVLWIAIRVIPIEFYQK